MTIFDYIEKSTKTFDEKEFNEIDNLVFSRLVYFKFDEILSFDEKISISEAYRRFILLEKNVSKGKTFANGTFRVFEKMAKSKRFKDILIGNYLSVISDSLEKQFAAMTFYLPNYIYVAFRGTDETLVALKEDFNMTYMVHIPSQKASVEYLENIAKENKFDIIIGGHSKGGNLAMYSAIFCKSKYKKRVVAVYNNDGPGFFNEIIENKNYQQVLDKIYTYVPQTSIIGMLLYHKEKMIVIKSNRSLIMQHDPDSWEVDLVNDKFVRVNSTNKKSKYIDEVMSSLVLMDDDKKKQFFEIIYQILTSTGARTVKDLSKEKVKNIKELLANYKKLDNEDKELFISVWKDIIETAKINISNYLPRKKDKVK